LFGDKNVRTVPELNIEEVVREKKNVTTGEALHAEDASQRV
jgi:hypothetical protein